MLSRRRLILLSFYSEGNWSYFHLFKGHLYFFFHELSSSVGLLAAFLIDFYRNYLFNTGIKPMCVRIADISVVCP